jgi:hypothetical protein
VAVGDSIMLADGTISLVVEERSQTEARGRVVDEWRLTPGRDNHWFDCLVGSAVAASYTGVSSVGVEARAGGAVHRKQISREEMQRKREELLSRLGR